MQGAGQQQEPFDHEYKLASLMKLVLEGDKGAYHTLLCILLPLLRRFFKNRVKDSQLVEDLCQDTLLKLHAYRDTYDPQRKYRPWLYAIAKNTLTDHFRRQNRKKMPSTSSIEVNDITDMKLAGAEEMIIFDQAFQSLKPEEQRLINLIKMEGQSLQEFSKNENISENAAKVRMHRALAAFKKLLQIKTKVKRA